MVVSIRELSQKVCLTDTVYIAGQKEPAIKVNGYIIAFTDLGCLNGPMDIHTLVNLFSGSDMEKDNCIGRMSKRFMKDFGQAVKSTEKELFASLMETGKLESGYMAKGCECIFAIRKQLSIYLRQINLSGYYFETSFTSVLSDTPSSSNVIIVFAVKSQLNELLGGASS